MTAESLERVPQLGIDPHRMEPLGSVRHGWATQPGELLGKSESAPLQKSIYAALNQRCNFERRKVPFNSETICLLQA